MHYNASILTRPTMKNRKVPLIPVALAVSFVVIIIAAMIVEPAPTIQKIEIPVTLPENNERSAS